MSIGAILGTLLWLGAVPPVDAGGLHRVSLHQESHVGGGGGLPVRLSAGEGQAHIARLVGDAQACIVQRVGDDPGFREAVRGGRVGELIVAAFRPCWPAVDALITAHDRQFGTGSGETFVTGPFLDRIPRIIEERLR